MSIVYINNNRFLIKDGDKIELKEKFEFQKNDIITSSIDIKDIITYTFKLPKSTPEEQLNTEAEIYFYENAGIDLNKKFISFYMFRTLEEEDSYLVEAIAIDEDNLHKKFNSLLTRSNWIDFISLSTLTFSEFYPTYKKEPKKDAFVYLDNEQSFIAVYENGEYLYSKTLNPLAPLLKILDMDYNKFIETISTKGVSKDNYDVDEFLVAGEIERFFSDYFMAINNRLSYGKTIFYLDHIDNIYFYTPFHIEGMDNLKSFWDLSEINFETIKVEDINFLDKLTLLYNEKHYEDKINFSIFPQPPQFYKTKSFQLFAIIFLTFAIFGGDFANRYYNNLQHQKNIIKIKKDIRIKSSKLRRLTIINKAILEQYNRYLKEIENTQKKIVAIKNILEQALIISEFPKTNRDFITFSNLLQKNNLKAFIIAKDENNRFFTGVYTEFKNRKFIGIFMDNLLQKNYKNITTKEIGILNNNPYLIKSKDNTHYYFSVIRFEK